MIKQVIVMRKDLNMRKGKMCAQAAHASMKVFFDRMDECYACSVLDAWELDGNNDILYECNFDSNMLEWMKRSFTKICVGVNSEQELLDIYNAAKNAGIVCAMIQDSGKTEFNGMPTYTCCAIGPADSEDIDKITGNLRLL